MTSITVKAQRKGIAVSFLTEYFGVQLPRDPEMALIVLLELCVDALSASENVADVYQLLATADENELAEKLGITVSSAAKLIEKAKNLE